MDETGDRAIEEARFFDETIVADEEGLGCIIIRGNHTDGVIGIL